MLEEVSFDCMDYFIVSQFYEQVMSIVSLNRQRHIHEPTFASLSQPGVPEPARRVMVLLALESIDYEYLYEFIRRNEWGLQELIRQYGREEVSAWTSTTCCSRKRPIDQL
jgi:hypothetical protein